MGCEMQRRCFGRLIVIWYQKIEESSRALCLLRRKDKISEEECGGLVFYRELKPLGYGEAFKGKEGVEKRAFGR